MHQFALSAITTTHSNFEQSTTTSSALQFLHFIKLTNIPHRCRLGATYIFKRKTFRGRGTIQITETTIEEAYKQVEVMLSEAVTTAKTEEQFKTNIGRLQLVGQRLLAIMIFNSCYGTKQNVYDVLELIGQGIKRELDGIQAAAKSGQANLTSVETILPNDQQPQSEH